MHELKIESSTFIWPYSFQFTDILYSVSLEEIIRHYSMTGVIVFYVFFFFLFFFLGGGVVVVVVDKCPNLAKLSLEFN